MTRSSRAARGSSFLALAGLPALGGGLAGLGDATLTIAGGWSAPSTASFFLLSASLGALLALGALLPMVLVVTIAARPRSPATRVASVLSVLTLTPALVVLGRSLFKRLPWGGGDLLLGGAGLLAVVVAATLLAWGLGRAFARVERGLLRALTVLAIPALLLTLPAGARIAAGLRAPSASRSGAAGGTNVLLLTVDTLRADAIGVMGDPVARTPFLDRIARRSTVHANCLAPSPWTLPSLGSVLTGTYPGEHRVLQFLSGLSETVPTLAEVCSDDDRRTGAFVSNPWLSTGSLARGFDDWDVAERIECLQEVSATRLYQTLSKVILRGFALDNAFEISERGIAWLDRGEGAWFLWLHYFDPHLPNWPHRPWDRLFGPPPSRVGSALTVDEVRAGRYSDAESRREIESLYRGEVALTDRAIGNVWRFLEERGSLGATAVVFSADHGEELWDHAGYGHGHAMFDEVVRVPLFLRPPGGADAIVTDDLTRLVDVAPTLVALAEIVPPGSVAFTGSNLLVERPRATFGEALLYGTEQKFLRTDRWKLVLRLAADDGPERLSLYDLRSDPGERVDVVTAEKDVADSLAEQLAVWMETVGSAGAMAARDLPDDIDPTIRAQLKALGYIE